MPNCAISEHLSLKMVTNNRDNSRCCVYMVSCLCQLPQLNLSNSIRGPLFRKLWLAQGLIYLITLPVVSQSSPRKRTWSRNVFPWDSPSVSRSSRRVWRLGGWLSGQKASTKMVAEACYRPISACELPDLQGFFNINHRHPPKNPRRD